MRSNHDAVGARLVLAPVSPANGRSGLHSGTRLRAFGSVAWSAAPERMTTAVPTYVDATRVTLPGPDAWSPPV